MSYDSKFSADTVRNTNVLLHHDNLSNSKFMRRNKGIDGIKRDKSRNSIEKPSGIKLFDSENIESNMKSNYDKAGMVISASPKSSEKCQDIIISSDDYSFSPTHNRDLNSSPIKSSSKKYNDDKIPSSPLKRRKTVVFSNNLVSEVSNNSAPNSCEATPKKSILKSGTASSISKTEGLENRFYSTVSTFLPEDPEFWHRGSVIQLPASSPELLDLLKGCISVLKIEGFDKRFEVYATLNHIFKTNSTQVVSKLFGTSSSSKNVFKGQSKGKCVWDSSIVRQLLALAQKDVTSMESGLSFSSDNKENIIESKSNPFSIRIINQALKLVNFIFLDQTLSSFVPAEEARWFYLRACSMIVRKDATKSLIIPYTIILKDVRFTGKKKSIIFDQSSGPIKLSKLILQSLMKMKYFASSSIISEKNIILRNLVLNFPEMMKSEFNHWFPTFILNMCDLNINSNTKIYDIYIQTLLEIAKCYNNDTTVSVSLRDIMETELPNTVPSVFCDRSLIRNEDKGQIQPQKILTYIVKRLQEMVENGLSKNAMEIWFSLTVLISNPNSGLVDWKFLGQWTVPNEVCFSMSDESSSVDAINSWGAVVYSIFISKLENLRENIDSSLASKKYESKSEFIQFEIVPQAEFLTRILHIVDPNGITSTVCDSFHNMILSLIYSIMNSPNLKSNLRYFYIIWDTLIVPIFKSFYLKEGSGSSYRNELGADLFSYLLKTNYVDSTFNSLRCLSSEKLCISEIASIPSNWVLNKSERVLGLVSGICLCKKIDTAKKLSCLTSFLNTVKMYTKKEIKTSELTITLLHSISQSVVEFMNLVGFSKDMLRKTMIKLNDAFDTNILLDRQPGMENSFYISLVTTYSNKSQFFSLRELLETLHDSLRESSKMKFLIELAELCSKEGNEKINKFILDAIENLTFQPDSQSNLEQIGNLLKAMRIGCDSILNKLVPELLSGPSKFETYIKSLSLVSWNIDSFLLFLVKVFASSRLDLIDCCLDAMKTKCESNDQNLILSLRSLNDNDLYYPIFSLKEYFVTRSAKLEGFHKFEFCSIWKKYLKKLQLKAEYSMLDQSLVCSIEARIEVDAYPVEVMQNLPLTRNLIDSQKLHFQTAAFNDVNVSNSIEHVDLQANKDKALSTDPSIEQVSCENEHLKSAILEKASQQSSPLKTPKKSKSTTPKQKNTSKPNNSPSNDPSFDIHSFTALLNAQLSQPNDTGKKRKRSRTQSKLGGTPKRSHIKQESQTISINDKTDFVNKIDKSTYKRHQTVEKEDEDDSFVVPLPKNRQVVEHFETEQMGEPGSSNSDDEMDSLILINNAQSDLKSTHPDSLALDITQSVNYSPCSVLKENPITKHESEQIDFQGSDVTYSKGQKILDNDISSHKNTFDINSVDSEQKESCIVDKSSPNEESQSKLAGIGETAVEETTQSINRVNDISAFPDLSNNDNIDMTHEVNLDSSSDSSTTEDLLSLTEHTTDEQILKLSDTEMFEIESALMAFMLRMRKVKSSQIN